MLGTRATLTLRNIHNGHDGLVDPGSSGHDAEEVEGVAAHPHHEGHEADGLKVARGLGVQGLLLASQKLLRLHRAHRHSALHSMSGLLKS